MERTSPRTNINNYIHAVMKLQRPITPLAMTLLVAVFLGMAAPAQAQDKVVPMKYKTDYFVSQHLYRNGKQLTNLSLSLEWPEYISGSKALALQSYLCSTIFGNNATSASEGLELYTKSLGRQIDVNPDEEGLRRQYVKLMVHQLGGEKDRYLSFSTLSIKRDGNSYLPEERKLTLFTYDIVNDKVLTAKDILSYLVYSLMRGDLMDEIAHYNPYFQYMYDPFPDQVCLIPQGLVFNIPNPGNGEGYDQLTVLPMQNAKKYMKRGVKKLAEKGKVKDVEGLVLSQQIVSPANIVDTTMVYDVVDEMPEFSGGMKDIAEFLTRVVKYPEYEEQMGIQGRVVVSFIVERDGSVSTPSVISPVSPGLDRESVNAVLSMPRWKPGRHNGVSVRTRMNVPVSFKLKKDK